MKFKVSTNIKSIIGKDLINDKYIAIFELVKNACDAGAKDIDIEFIKEKDQSKIIISDNGCGMSTDDLQNKWLFIAYSEKKEENAKGKKYAGSKGIGRFSCDRLGKVVTLYTKKTGASKADRLLIDWDLFEKNDLQRVEEIVLDHTEINELPSKADSGTVLEISALREEWERADLLRLRSALMKLISPEKSQSHKNPNIEIIAKHELEKDNEEQKLKKSGVPSKTTITLGNLKVNGLIKNDIFEKMGIKTTSIEVCLSEDGTTIDTVLEDRGSFIFRVRRINETYDKLENIKIKVFYLNRSAKLNFTKTMAIEPVNYGSIFIYRNGFRIYPYGNPTIDFFGINARKAQGYNRFLGTREMMGRIEINGENDRFVEKTSRDGGFIENFATKQLEEFFLSEVVRVLEKYVVEGIDWGDPPKKDFIEGYNEQGLMPIDVPERVVQQFASLTKKGEIIYAEINPDILYKASPTQDVMQKSIKSLEKIAQASESSEIHELVAKIKEESENLKKQKEEAQRSVDFANEELRKKEFELKVREKQTASLQRQISANPAQYEDALHVIYAITDPCVKELNSLYRIVGRENASVAEKLAKVLSINTRVLKIADLAVNYDYSLSVKKAKDLVEFIKQYIKDFWADKINIFVTTLKSYKLVCNFDVAKLSLIIDNVVSNSKKHKAKNIEIIIEQKFDRVSLLFNDDGTGLDKGISNVESIFERGFSTTFGMGLGLYHVDKLAKDMSGEVRPVKNVKQGFALEVLFRYECKF